MMEFRLKAKRQGGHFKFNISINEENAFPILLDQLYLPDCRENQVISSSVNQLISILGFRYSNVV